MATIAEDKTKAQMDELTRLFQQTRINEAEKYIKDERKRKVAVMNFGRLNPPTRGHYKLLEYIADQAKLLGGKGFIFLSASQNYLPPHKGTKWRPVVNRVTKSTFRSNKSNENPLSVWDKMNILHKFPKIENLEYINPQGEKGRPYSMDRAADYLRNSGYTDIYLVVGTDRFKQLKDKGVEKTWNLTLIEHPRSERLEDLTLYSIDKTIPKKSLEINPEAISGTKSRAAAAEHAINGINGIDSMTLRQAEEAIMNRKNPMHQSHGFITFKEYMPSILTDSQLELIIYKIKKGMLLRPSESYTNHHKRNRMVRRSSMTKKKGGKRRRKTRKKRGGLFNWFIQSDSDTDKFDLVVSNKAKRKSIYGEPHPLRKFIVDPRDNDDFKEDRTDGFSISFPFLGGKRRRKTRKKRGGMERINVEGMWVDITLNDIKLGETYRVTTTSYRGVIPSPFIGTYKDVSQNSSMQNIFRFSIQPIHPGLRGTGPLDFTFPEGTIQRVEQYNIAPNGNRDLGREIKSFVAGRRKKKTRKKRGGTANLCKLFFDRNNGNVPIDTDHTVIDKYCKDHGDTNIPPNTNNLCEATTGNCWLPVNIQPRRQLIRVNRRGNNQGSRRASVASTSLAPGRLRRQGGKRRRKKKTRKKRKRKGRKSKRRR